MWDVTNTSPCRVDVFVESNTHLHDPCSVPHFRRGGVLIPMLTSKTKTEYILVVSLSLKRPQILYFNQFGMLQVY